MVILTSNQFVIANFYGCETEAYLVVESLQIFRMTLCTTYIVMILKDIG